MRYVIFLACVLFAISGMAQQTSAPADSQVPDTNALLQQIKDLQERVIALEGKVRTLQQSGPPAPPANTTGETAPSGIPTSGSETEATVAQSATATTPPKSLGGAANLAKALNPDISMIGDFLGSVGGNSRPLGALQSPFRSLEMHESELGIQAIIDPYARGDIFLTFGEEGVGLEEGYITLTSLPAGFVARIGKMRAAFGKVNTMHNHVMPWVDRPLVTDNLMGGEDGIDDAGISVTRTLPAPKGLFLEATGQIFRGDSGGGDSPLFVASRKSDVSTVAHLRGYRDLSESTNLDLGVSFSQGHNGLSSTSLTRLYGMDATLRWKPLRRSIYHSFVARSEFIWSQRQQLSPGLQRAFGYYAAGDYQLGRRWFLGGRFDSSERPALAIPDRGASAVLTYWPSEFSQIRTQFRHTRFADGRDANELLLQVQFVLGAHGAHPF